MGLLLRHWTWVNAAFVAFSVAAYYVTVAVLNSIFCPDSHEPVPACGIVIPQVPARKGPDSDGAPVTPTRKGRGAGGRGKGKRSVVELVGQGAGGRQALRPPPQSATT